MLAAGAASRCEQAAAAAPARSDPAAAPADRSKPLAEELLSLQTPNERKKKNLKKSIMAARSAIGLDAFCLRQFSSVRASIPGGKPAAAAKRKRAAAVLRGRAHISRAGKHHELRTGTASGRAR